MSQDTGHLTGEPLKAKNHPGNPRDFLGPVKTNPAELFLHTTEDLTNLDHFLEFFLGNGQITCRLDALSSQHIRGRNSRGVMGIRHAEAWGAEAFPYYRCRPVGRLLNNLFVGSRQKPLEPGDLYHYQQQMDMQDDILKTSFDWCCGDSQGHTTISVFISQVDPDVIVLRFCDRLDKGTAQRQAAVETIVPYPYRLTKAFGEATQPAQPGDNTQYHLDDSHSQSIDYELCSSEMSSRFSWYGQAIPSADASSEIKLESRDNGGMTFAWNCPIGRTTQVDIVYAVVSDHSARDCHAQARSLAREITQTGVNSYQDRHVHNWHKIWNESALILKDGFWQKQWEISRYTLLVNTGSRWLGNIAADEPAWDAHMLDSIIALNSLLEWNHLDLARMGYKSLDRLYPGARDNASLVSEYIGEELTDEAALLPTFLTYDGRVALYCINHFMLHSEQNAGHCLGLLQLADYSDAESSATEMAYRWLRAYANYALLISQWDDNCTGYVFPMWKAGTLQEGEWWPYQQRAASLEKIDSIADLFPEELRHKNLVAPVDVVMSHKWVLEKAADLAEQLGRDPQLISRWRQVAQKIYIPQNKEMILRHEHDDGKAPGHIPPELWGLFYPCKGNHAGFSAELINNTLRASYQRRNSCIPSWNALFYAIAYSTVGDGKTAWLLLQELLSAKDPRCIQAQDNVNTEGFVYYYFLNDAFLLIAMRRMLLGDQNGQITLFPALPPSWEEKVEFHRLPISGGIHVDAQLHGQQGQASFYARNGQLKLKVIGKVKGFTISQADIIGAAGDTIKL